MISSKDLFASARRAERIQGSPDPPRPRQSGHRRSCAAGGERRSRWALLGFGLVAVQTQQGLVQFADGLQGFSHLVVTLQSLAHLGNLLRTEAQLAGLAAGVTHIKNP